MNLIVVKVCLELIPNFRNFLENNCWLLIDLRFGIYSEFVHI